MASGTEAAASLWIAIECLIRVRHLNPDGGCDAMDDVAAAISIWTSAQTKQEARQAVDPVSVTLDTDQNVIRRCYPTISFWTASHQTWASDKTRNLIWPLENAGQHVPVGS